MQIIAEAWAPVTSKDQQPENYSWHRYKETFLLWLVVIINFVAVSMLLLLMFKILSRNKPARGPAAGGQTAKEKEKKDLPKLEDFLQARDYSGAMTLLEVRMAFIKYLLLACLV